MKRRDVFKGMMLALAVILAVVLFGCDRDQVDPAEIPEPTDHGVLVGTEGGVVVAMDGDVVITIPAGALAEEVWFDVRELMNKSVGGHALKTIVVWPLVLFNKPAQIALKYDGCLGYGLNLCEAKSVTFSIWDDVADFIENGTPKVCSFCNVNPYSHTVCMCICQTGVIATKAEL